MNTGQSAQISPSSRARRCAYATNVLRYVVSSVSARKGHTCFRTYSKGSSYRLLLRAESFRPEVDDPHSADSAGDIEAVDTGPDHVRVGRPWGSGAASILCADFCRDIKRPALVEGP